MNDLDFDVPTNQMNRIEADRKDIEDLKAEIAADLNRDLGPGAGSGISHTSSKAIDLKQWRLDRMEAAMQRRLELLRRAAATSSANSAARNN